MNTYFKIGDKVQILEKEESIDLYAYDSVVEDIIDEVTIIIAVPILRGSLVRLHRGKVYSIVIISDKVILESNFEVNRIFKEDNHHHLEVKIISEFTKFERRDYFRHSCLLPLKFTQLLDDYHVKIDNMFKDNMLKGVMIDISGGGIRFISNENIEIDGSKLKCIFFLRSELIVAIATILEKKTSTKRAYRFQYRVKFENILPDDREKIIQYIFSEQRRKINPTGK